MTVIQPNLFGLLKDGGKATSFKIEAIKSIEFKVLASSLK